MQHTKLAAGVDAELRHSPARLDVVTPWELPDAAKSVIAESIAGEAWLERLGLQGILTGITNSDMRTFRSSVERLAGMLRYARQEGERIGRDEATEKALDDREAELAIARREAHAWAWGGVGVGFFLGGALVGAIFSFF